MTRKFFDSILDCLKDREPWERKQSEWYRMRHGNVPRVNKPYPGASNLRFKLADALTEKIKPYYIQQLYTDETIYSFISLKQQDSDLTTAAAYWFDWQIKNNSNFERETYSGVDQMLESGSIPLKVYWDPEPRTLCFDAVNPLHVIVPDWTKEYADADWLVHVLQYSEAQYCNNERYNQDEDFIKRIKGKGNNTGSSGDIEKYQLEMMREGLTYGKEDQIIVWEVYRKEGTGKGAKWMVDYISPVAGPDDPVAPSFGLPFQHGMLPFCKIRYEITKKGQYSSRGITEITAPHEAFLSKTFTTMADWMDFTARPTFESDQPIPNATNYRNIPGSIRPPGLKMSAPPPRPVELSEDMQFGRALAEYRVQMPDLGASEHLSPAGQSTGKPTATQINAIVGQSGQGNDMRARIFRLDLGDIGKMAWSILVQYNSQQRFNADGTPDTSTFMYVVGDTIQQLDPAALHDKYLITPNGSPDSWNKGARLNKALTMYQLLQDNPFIDKGELTKFLLEHDDPRVIKRLYKDPGIQSQDQAEQQQIEIVQILNNFGCQIHEQDDDKVHCAVGQQFFQGRMQEGAPVSPQQAQAFIQHFGSHLQALVQKKDPAAKQVYQSLSPYLGILQHLASTMPPNVVSMSQPSGGVPPGSTPPAGAQPSVPTPQASAGSEASNPDKKAQNAIAAGNMLANLIKAGVAVSQGDINTVFDHLGLPQLPVNPVHPPQAKHLPGQKPPPPPAQPAQGAQ